MSASPLYRSERLRRYVNTRLHHGGAVAGAGALLTTSDDGDGEEGEDDVAEVEHGRRLLWRNVLVSDRVDGAQECCSMWKERSLTLGK
jgi:hypothetical protein